MQHIYLSETVINDALVNHAITVQEAEKLKQNINMQATIYKSITK